MDSYKDDLLIHSGVKGMRWGVRRYQNYDGSLTSAGKRRYNTIQQTSGRGKNVVGNTTNINANRPASAVQSKSGRGKDILGKVTGIKTGDSIGAKKPVGNGGAGVLTINGALGSRDDAEKRTNKENQEILAKAILDGKIRDGAEIERLGNESATLRITKNGMIRIEWRENGKINIQQSDRATKKFNKVLETEKRRRESLARVSGGISSAKRGKQRNEYTK